MIAGLLLDVRFDSEDSWGAFQLQHGMMHQAVYEELLRQDFSPKYLDLYGFPKKENQEYLLAHWQVHLSNASALGLTQVPDLSAYDFSQENQFRDFLALHTIVHANENAALGIM